MCNCFVESNVAILNRYRNTVTGIVQFGKPSVCLGGLLADVRVDLIPRRKSAHMLSGDGSWKDVIHARFNYVTT